MRDVLLVRFGEVHLKGQNRPYFLRKLVSNVRRAVEDIGGHVWLADSRIYVSQAQDMAQCIERVCKVFGVHSVSPAVEMDKDYEAIAAQCVEMMRGKTGSFKVNARRSDKRFPMDSMVLQRELGGRILEAMPHLKVDVHKPDHVMSVEIRDFAYLYVDEVMGVGGMPMGTGGRAALLLSGGIDSPVAGWSIMKRGVQVQGIHFHSFPYTSERAKQKVLDLAAIMGEYAGNMLVHVVPFTEIQLAIHEKCPDELGTVLMRRYMMRIAQRLAQKNRCQALITGESIGQVASQTMEALVCTDQVVDMPVFRPLIGMDKLEIMDIARKIGTYETSIQPFEDCCTVFTPRHPCTKPKIEDLIQAEQALDSEALIQKAVEETQSVWVK
ncbi:MAG TPA: tRNA 4-thiouridine(8) synthase ThiI [Candidatus Faecaligallichristensenella faecipullorum]|nr:tRNA 4-thiouridine(8) synthase ThiI [Candidatus Faecaligallichristensenella faecipullorum]